MHVDEAFADLFGRMTNLFPAKKITAREALAYSWFTRAIPEQCQTDQE